MDSSSESMLIITGADMAAVLERRSCLCELHFQQLRVEVLVRKNDGDGGYFRGQFYEGQPWALKRIGECYEMENK